MYKTKLQELCHKNRWGLPRYSSMKDGLDHVPSFMASVCVNGSTFDSPGAFKSSKEAQNQAAMLSVHHFSASQPGSLTSPAENDTEEQIGAANSQHISPPQDSSVIIDDTDNLCKSQLQSYAQRKRIHPPTYKSIYESSPHAALFKATVTVDGQSFESPSFFNTRREAEQAAAKVALLSLSIDIFGKGDPGLFKNLLLEFTQREGFCKPTYKTVESGPSHSPTFISIVEVEGKEFHGRASKTKKQAKQEAAKVSYTALKECGFHMNAASSSSNSTENKALQSSHTSDIVKSEQNLEHEGLFPSSSATNKDELKELDSDEILPANVKVSNELCNPLLLQPTEEDMRNRSSLSSELVSESSQKRYSPFSKLDISCLSVTESKKAKTPETSSYLLCDRFKVYTCFPDIVFPEGITVLPISDSRWVAVSLEFPK